MSKIIGGYPQAYMPMHASLHAADERTGHRCADGHAHIDSTVVSMACALTSSQYLGSGALIFAC